MTCNVPTEQYLVPRPHTPPSEKQSGEQSWISWACYQNVVRTDEIVRLVIICTCISLLEYPYLFEWVCCKMFWTLLGDTVTKVCGRPKKFNLVHQTVSPHEGVESGDETSKTDTTGHHQFSLVPRSNPLTRKGSGVISLNPWACGSLAL